MTQKKILISKFENLSPSQEDDYLSSAVASEIMHLLSKYKNLHVISGYSKELLEAKSGKSISIRFHIEGSYIKISNRVRFNVRLIDGENAACLLSIKLEEDSSNMFKLLDSIAIKIVQFLNLELAPNQEKLQILPEAYDHYLKGMQHWNSWDIETVKQAINQFNKTIALEPEFALGHVRLSECYSFLATLDKKDNTKHYLNAKLAAKNAIRIDDTSIEAHLSLALLKLINDLDILGAYYSFEKAFSIDNTNPRAHKYYAFYLITIGKYQKAIKNLEYALDSDPLNLQANATYGFALMLSNKHLLAEKHLKKALSLFPDSEIIHDSLIWNYIASKQYEKAKKLVENNKVNKLLSPVIEITLYKLLQDQKKLQIWEDKLNKLLDQKDNSSYAKEASAGFYNLGNTTLGLKYFETFYKNKMGFIRALSHPAWKNLRESDKFYIYKKRLKLLRPQLLPEELTSGNPDVIVLHSDTSEILATESHKLLFIESQGVYCNVIYLNQKNEITRHLLRSSLTKIINNNLYPYFIRCHNSFIVNTKIPFLIAGNRKNSWLSLDKHAIKIPVSRRNTTKVFEVFNKTNN